MDQELAVYLVELTLRMNEQVRRSFQIIYLIKLGNNNCSTSVSMIERENGNILSVSRRNVSKSSDILASIPSKIPPRSTSSSILPRPNPIPSPPTTCHQSHVWVFQRLDTARQSCVQYTPA